eukprot:10958455-Ditylum_brightwellii.AAC.1
MGSTLPTPTNKSKSCKQGVVLPTQRPIDPCQCNHREAPAPIVDAASKCIQVRPAHCHITSIRQNGDDN